MVPQSFYRPMLEVLGLVDLHYVVGALLFGVAWMGAFAGHLRHHILLQVIEDTWLGLVQCVTEEHQGTSVCCPLYDDRFSLLPWMVCLSYPFVYWMVLERKSDRALSQVLIPFWPPL